MAPDDSDFLCGGWLWDPVLRELRHYRRRRKGWEDEPEATERLRPVRSVTWHRWSQAPMATATGQAMPGRLSRIVAAYEAGGDLTINENDRECAERLVGAIAEAFGLEVIGAGAPGGPRPGTAPRPDEMGRLVHASRGREVALDETAGEIVESRRRFPFGRKRRRIPLADVRRLELGRAQKGPMETYTLWALVGADEERLPVASYEGYEGWADAGEWAEFARGLGARLRVEVTLPG